MATVDRDTVRIPNAVGVLGAGNANANGSSFPVISKHTRQANIIRRKVTLNSLGLGITAAVGGAADGAGQKILTLPKGYWLILAVNPELTVTTPAGLTVATAVWSLGTALATDANAALTSTEADVLASQTLGDGTLAAAASEQDLVPVIGTGTTPAIVGSPTADVDVYFNIGGTFTHATITTQTIQIAGDIELIMIDLGVN